MEIRVNRYLYRDNCTLSYIDIDYEPFCYGLEPEYTAARIKPRAIPCGKYKVAFRKQGLMLEKLKRKKLGIGQERGTLHVLDVPDFKYVLIHIGNTPKDTEGCLLLGRFAGIDEIIHSTVTYKEFYSRVATALEKGEKVTIEYTNGWDL